MWFYLLHCEPDVSRYRMPWICIVSTSLYYETSLRKYTGTETRIRQFNFVPIRHQIRQPAMIWPDTGSGKIGRISGQAGSEPDIRSVPAHGTR